jgi:SAM-dependent methyltransferase
MTLDGPELKDHNLQQRSYFRGANKRTMLPDDTPYNWRQAAELIRFAHLVPGQHVLEVGCGMGRHTFLLARAGINIEGLDLSPELIARFRAFDAGGYNIPVHVGDILEYGERFRDSFDAVVGFFMLHHLHHDLSGYFRAMTGMVRPGGCLAFMEPNPNNPLYYFQIFFTPGMQWRAEKGILQMRERTVFHEMGRAGLSHLEVKRLGFFPPFISNRSWGAKLERALESIGMWQGLLPFQMFKGYRRQ